MNKIIKIIIPSLLMLLLIHLMRSGKYILDGIYLVFPIIYIVLGLIYSNFKKELLISLLLISLTFIILINLYFRMGSCIETMVIYNILSISSYLIKDRIKKKRKN